MEHEKRPLLLGAHMSVAGGLDQAIVKGESIGCTTIQIFTKSNRQWFAKSLDDQDIIKFKTTLEQSIIKKVIVHAAYLINVASTNPLVKQKSTKALIQELYRCSQLGISYLVLHPGSKGEMNENAATTQIANELNEAIKATPDNTMILLETMAGQGSNLCYRFEQLAAIYAQIENKKRIGICFDTCHAFAAGYDFRSRESYEKLWNLFDTILDISLIKAIHINDSKKNLGARVDRHEHIGKGQLGLEPFRLLFNDPRFFNIPKILETPKEGIEDDLKNMQQIVDLIDKQTKKNLSIYVVGMSLEAKSK